MILVCSLEQDHTFLFQTKKTPQNSSKELTHLLFSFRFHLIGKEEKESISNYFIYFLLYLYLIALDYPTQENPMLD